MNVKMPQKNLTSILESLQAEMPFKEDLYMNPKLDLRMMPENGFMQLQARQNQLEPLGYSPTDWSLSQLAGRLGIDTRYLKRCPSELQAENVNYWLEQLKPETNWLVRTYHHPQAGVARARGFLSDKYSPFDDHEFLDILANLFPSGADYKINMWHRDEAGFHLRVLLPDLTTSIGKTVAGDPDIHMVGLHIENSEVGKKSIKIRPIVYRMICTNGLFGWQSTGEGLQQRHVHLNHREMHGRVATAIGESLRVGDEIIETVRQSREVAVENPLDVIKKLAEDKKYSKETAEHLTEAFHLEPGNTAFHVTQAWTRAAQRYSEDTRVELERDAGRLMKVLVQS